MENILPLINEKKHLEEQLSSLVYGAPEIRIRGDKKYIYVNYRENGRKISSYVGEYNDFLYNTILSNTVTAKKLKKSIAELNRKISQFDLNANGLSNRSKLAIDFARKNLVNSIQGQAVLEGIATTAIETEEIIAGLKIQGISDEDARKILNLKHAWDFILNEYVVQESSNFGILSQINKLVEEGFYYNAGKIRTVPVKIGGTDWHPEIPLESSIKEEIDDILNSHRSNAEIGIELLLYIMRKQIFIDGNKRTAVIFANHFLISTGTGVIFIDPNTTNEYKQLLIEYYETNKKDKITDFLKRAIIELKFSWHLASHNLHYFLVI